MLWWVLIRVYSLDLPGSITLTAADEHSKDVDAIATAIVSLHDRPKKRPRAAEHANDGTPPSKSQCQAAPDQHTGPLKLDQIPGYNDAFQSAKTLCGLVGASLPMSEQGLKATLTSIYREGNSHAQQPYDLKHLCIHIVRSCVRSCVGLSSAKSRSRVSIT